MTQPVLTVGLLWHSMNSDNLGVGALTMSNIAIIEGVAARLGFTPRFEVIGWTDPRPHYETRDDVAVTALRMKDFLPVTGGLARAVRRSDLILDIGAGDSFTDIYGTHRIGTLLGSKLIVLLGGKPLILSPQTVGPFEKPHWRALARMLMNRARAVVTRDALSTAFLGKMNVRAQSFEATDVAMRLPYDPPAPRDDGGPLRIGLNVSGLLMNGGYTKANQFGLKADYPDLIHAMIGDILARDNVELHLVGHVISDDIEVEDDYRASQKLAEAFPGTILAPKFATPSEAKTYIAGMDVFAGARMHACIAAFSSGVPVLPMAYSRKFEGVFGTLGYERLADCKADSADEVRAKLADLIDNRDAAKAEVDAAFARASARLDPYEAVIADCLRAALDKRS